MTRPEVERIRQEFGVPKVREDEPMPLEGILTALRDYADRLFAENAGEREFDIHPMFHAEGRDGSAVVVTEGFPGPAEKEAAVEAWRMVLRQVAGRAWGTVMTAWGLEHREEGGPIMDPDDPRYLPPSEHPDRVEWAVVQGSDLRRYEVWRAGIVRDEAGVRLEPWVRLVEGPLSQSGGDMVTPFVEAVLMSALADAFRTTLIDRPDEWWTWERLHAANRILDRAGEGDLGRLLGGNGDDDPRPGFAQTIADHLTLELLADDDGVLGIADEVWERAGIERPQAKGGDDGQA